MYLGGKGVGPGCPQSHLTLGEGTETSDFQSNESPTKFIGSLLLCKVPLVKKKILIAH